MSDPESERDAVRWLWYALEDQGLAETLAGMHLAGARHVCWLAQQAAEKAIKAVLVYEGIDFPRTHDLARLSTLVPEGWSVRDIPQGLGLLTGFAVEARYPGEWGEATTGDATQALALARSVVTAARADLLARGLAGVEDLPDLPVEPG